VKNYLILFITLSRAFPVYPASVSPDFSLPGSICKSVVFHFSHLRNTQRFCFSMLEYYVLRLSSDPPSLTRHPLPGFQFSFFLAVNKIFEFSTHLCRDYFPCSRILVETPFITFYFSNAFPPHFPFISPNRLYPTPTDFSFPSSHWKSASSCLIGVTKGPLSFSLSAVLPFSQSIAVSMDPP